MSRSILLLLACASGCSGSDGNPSPSDVTTCLELVGSCPKAVASYPSYAKTVEPIFQNNCVGCHSPAGGEGFDLVTYPEVYNQAGAMVSWISECSMPPPSYPPLTTAQRQTLLDWLACGAPDN
jgi:mono/diheme cytochrome c family protein